MNLPIDLRKYGVKKIINSNSVQSIDLSDIEAGQYIVTLNVGGEKIKVDFQTKENAQNEITLLTNGMIKL